MSELLPFIVIGLTSGAVYGLTGTGLVLTYKTSGILNFAQGAVATVAAYLFYILWQQHHVPWPIASFISIVVLGVVMGFGLELLARGLAPVSPTMKIVGMLGVVLLVEGLALAKYGNSGTQVNEFLPTSSFLFAGVHIQYSQVIIVALSLALVGGLFVYLRNSRTGVAMRAVVDDPELVAAGGTNPTTVRAKSWIIGCIFACLSGVLLVPSIGLAPTQLTLLVIQAFGAAAIGYFSNLPLAYAGGLAIGVVSAIATKYVGTQQIISGLPSSIPFIVLFVVLIVMPRGKLVDRKYAKLRPLPTWRAPRRFQVGGGCALLAVLLLVPLFVGAKLTVYSNGLTDVILFLSLGLLVRSSGQVSLAQVTFAAIGAAAFAHFTTSFHFPWLLGLIAAGLVVIPIGGIIAIPAIRLSGVYLALATLGFGIFVSEMFYSSKYMFTPFAQGVLAKRPGIWGLGSEKGYYYLLLGFAVMAASFVVVVGRARLGRLLRAMADSSIALESLGASTNVARVLVFCLSAFLAAISGGLLGGLINFVSGGQFDPLASLTYVAVLALVAGEAPWYAFGAALGLDIIPSLFNGGNVTNYFTVVFGVSAIYVAVTVERSGRGSERLRHMIDRLGGRRPQPALIGTVSDDVASEVGQASMDPPELADRAMTTPSLVATSPVGSAEQVRSEQTTGSGLQIESVSVRYGGAIAVDQLTLHAPIGRITGLIGPNGAGKTTTFNACSGFVRPSAGRVLFDGTDISPLRPAARARLGIGRSFQRMELFDSMTTAQNIAMGVEASMAGGRPLRHMVSGRNERRIVNDTVADVIALCGVTRMADVQTGLLSTGERRLVELARCLAGPFRLLLLDEPSSGLDNDETRDFAAVLKRAVDERGIGILLVEHDMSLVMGVCEYIYVLDFGQLIFDGTPESVAASDMVRQAYLGSDAVESEAHHDVGVPRVP